MRLAVTGGVAWAVCAFLEFASALAGCAACTPCQVQVLTLRQEKAELLGFSNFAELSMASKVSWASTLNQRFCID